MSHLQEPPANDRIAELRMRLESEEGAPDSFTLEEVMEVFYNRPCRRVSPQDYSVRKRKFTRGSKLVMKDEIILVLGPEDNTLNYGHRHFKYAGMRGKKYAGLLPHSRVFTPGGTLIYFDEPNAVREMREAVRLNELEREGLDILPAPGLFEANEAGQLNDHRCSEAFGLAGFQSARRWKKLLPLVFPAKDVWVL